MLGSAAAVTLGSHAVPVYEIYKVGADPAWADGLDLLGELTGVAAAVMPHYDNKEGATHDTRYCYLGEQRLALLEEALPDEVGVLGVDEHTAMVIDVEAADDDGGGNGLVSVRRRGTTTHVRGGGVARARRAVGAAARRAGLDGVRCAAPSYPRRRRSRSPPANPVALSLRAEADRARTAFEAALAARDADGCVAAVLGLEQAIADWQSRHVAERRRRRGAPGAACAGRAARRARRARRGRPRRRRRAVRRGADRRADGRPGTTRTSPPPTWCATGWSPPASRSATPPTAPSGPSRRDRPPGPGRLPRRGGPVAAGPRLQGGRAGEPRARPGTGRARRRVRAGHRPRGDGGVGGAPTAS